MENSVNESELEMLQVARKNHSTSKNLRSLLELSALKLLQTVVKSQFKLKYDLYQPKAEIMDLLVKYLAAWQDHHWETYGKSVYEFLSTRKPPENLLIPFAANICVLDARVPVAKDVLKTVPRGIQTLKVLSEEYFSKRQDKEDCIDVQKCIGRDFNIQARHMTSLTSLHLTLPHVMEGDHMLHMIGTNLMNLRILYADFGCITNQGVQSLCMDSGMKIVNHRLVSISLSSREEDSCLTARGFLYALLHQPDLEELRDASLRDTTLLPEALLMYYNLNLNRQLKLQRGVYITYVHIYPDMIYGVFTEAEIRKMRQVAPQLTEIHFQQIPHLLDHLNLHNVTSLSLYNKTDNIKFGRLIDFMGKQLITLEIICEKSVLNLRSVLKVCKQLTKLNLKCKFKPTTEYVSPEINMTKLEELRLCSPYYPKTTEPTEFPQDLLLNLLMKNLNIKYMSLTFIRNFNNNLVHNLYCLAIQNQEPYLYNLKTLEIRYSYIPGMTELSYMMLLALAPKLDRNLFINLPVPEVRKFYCKVCAACDIYLM